jgi:hypothetical protein
MKKPLIMTAALILTIKAPKGTGGPGLFRFAEASNLRRRILREGAAL